jgi:hypothetical protein
MDELGRRIDVLAAAVAGLADKVGALDARLERLDERHDDQYDRLTSLQETLLVLAEALGRPAGELSCAVCPWSVRTPTSWTRRTRSAVTGSGSRSATRRWST